MAFGKRPDEIVFDKVVERIAATLGRKPGEIRREDFLMKDLGAKRIDINDLPDSLKVNFPKFTIPLARLLAYARNAYELVTVQTVFACVWDKIKNARLREHKRNQCERERLHGRLSDGIEDAT